MNNSSPNMHRNKNSAMAIVAFLALPMSLAVAGRQHLPSAPGPDDFPTHRTEQIALGRFLFYDKLLSGNLNVSCATCHHGLTFTGDGLSLSVGEGGQGLGVTRDVGSGADRIDERVPRNAPVLFNIGAFEYRVMFHDGRVEDDPSQPSGFRSPAGDDLPLGLASVLAAQAMFPVTSGTEMAGAPGENPVADAAAAGDLPEVWRLLTERLRDPANGYVDLFVEAFPSDTPVPPRGPGPVQDAGDIQFAHAANALAAFEDFAYRSINSPFDQYLRGQRGALSLRQRAGMHLFYGYAGCAECHSGAFQTDHGFHAIAIPQIGPGKGDPAPGGDSFADFGRERVTLDPKDRYRFRTPALRNVVCTGPWGHSGAYDSLEAVVRHHLNPAMALHGYDTSQAVLPSHPELDRLDLVHHLSPLNRDALLAAAARDLDPPWLPERAIGLLIDFLHALTDPASLDLRATVPASVPSGLPVRD